MFECPWRTQGIRVSSPSRGHVQDRTTPRSDVVGCQEHPVWDQSTAATLPGRSQPCGPMVAESHREACKQFALSSVVIGSVCLDLEQTSLLDHKPQAFRYKHSSNIFVRHQLFLFCTCRHPRFVASSSSTPFHLECALEEIAGHVCTKKIRRERCCVVQTL